MSSGHITLGQRLGRGLAGLCLGWAWCSIFSAGWVVVAAAGYGDLDRALSELKREGWVLVAFAGYFASATGSWAGGAVAPVALGSSRARRPILTSSALGAAIGGVAGTLAGLSAGWLICRAVPRSMLAVWVPLGLGLVVGAAAGWVAGRLLTRTRSQ